MEYGQALQHPQIAFRNKTLKKCKIKLNQKKQPLGYSGNYATVYKGTLPDGTHRAVRVFTRYLEGTEEPFERNYGAPRFSRSGMAC